MILEGFVEQIEGDTAYVRLRNEYGDTFYGQYPAQELQKKGIVERRRFKCQITNSGQVILESIPDKEISKEQEQSIRKEIEQTIRDDLTCD